MVDTRRMAGREVDRWSSVHLQETRKDQTEQGNEVGREKR